VARVSPNARRCPVAGRADSGPVVGHGGELRMGRPPSDRLAAGGGTRQSVAESGLVDVDLREPAAIRYAAPESPRALC
jgi:hypothetical protein